MMNINYKKTIMKKFTNLIRLLISIFFSIILFRNNQLKISDFLLTKLNQKKFATKIKINQSYSIYI